MTQFSYLPIVHCGPKGRTGWVMRFVSLYNQGNPIRFARSSFVAPIPTIANKSVELDPLTNK